MMTSAQFVNHKKILRVLIAACSLMLICVAALLHANKTVSCFDSLIYDDVTQIPENEYCLVLGTSKYVDSGELNLFFKYRIEAAVQLYKAGKVHRIIVSGDNGHSEYNEPEDMKNSLVDAGVPEEHILCDYAGFRTLDSVVRAKNVFGVSECTIVSQRDHCRRALFIASCKNIDAIGFEARNVSVRYYKRNLIREPAACLLAWLDVKILGRKAHFEK